MLRSDGYGDPAIDGDRITWFLKEHDFEVIVSIRKHDWLVARWRYREQLPTIDGHSVYRVSDAPFGSGATEDLDEE